ncbi:hypothetical protein DASC09_035070 [Saccharomycopsis crataegensis]|uniref:Aminotransferase n=1 Tax=Saccharomycopsis crataegensis TaxID=43959 RepID=A0AAV5QNK9_9ASCO|nr:hypothetical protein DASC09_035070 [Saccharomycopsis crataegensis]
MTKSAQPLVIQSNVSAPKPMAVDGDGIYITLEDPITKERTTLIDGSTGAAVGAVGHKDPEIIEAMKHAAETSVYNYPGAISNYPSEELAEFLVQNSPKDAFAAVLITGSGSESVENALKLAKQYQDEIGQTQRYKFVSRKKTYHGYTMGCLSMGHNPRRTRFDKFLGDPKTFLKTEAVYPYRDLKEGETLEQYKDRLVKDVEDTFIANDPSTIVGWLGETVVGSTFGTCPPVPGYLEGVREVCHKYGILFMLDEVMSGIGRCGTFHAWEQYLPENQGPDIQTIGKTLGSGYVTIAAVLVSPKVKNALTDGSNYIIGAQTYHQHAFNCQVALAVQKKVKRDNLIANMKEQGNYLGAQLKEKLLGKSKIVGDVRGSGGFWSLELVKDTKTKEPFAADLKMHGVVGKQISKNGATSMPCPGTVDNKIGDHVLFAPSFIITREQTDKLIDIVVKSVFEVEEQIGA